MERKINLQAISGWPEKAPEPLDFQRPKRLRFAPSPNGYLHLGHAYSAQVNWTLANLFGATCLLRIEDIDQGRTRADYVDAIFDDLAWLGFEWPEPVLFQSTRFDTYQKALDELIARNLVYPAFLSRKEIKQAVAQAESHGRQWPKDPDGSPIYPGQCKHLTASEREARIARGDAYNWRLDMAAALAQVNNDLFWQEMDEKLSLHPVKAEPEKWGDMVLARRDVPTSYHLSVVMDDAFQGIDCVVRGLDLYPATAIHCLLQYLLDLPRPIYHHHALIADKTMQKLSKSDGATSLKELREVNALSADDVRFLISRDQG